MRRDDDCNHPHPTDGQIPYPLRSSKKLPLTSANDPLVSLNDGAHTGTTLPKPRRKQRMKPRDIDELASWLSERDFGILGSVAEHQFLTVHQVEALHFGDLAPTSGGRIARRTLARLREYRLLGTLKRRIGGVKSGSAGLVHYLDTAGDQLLNKRSAQQGRRRSRDPSTRFLSHRLAIADAHVALAQSHRQQSLELVECVVEPISWRRFLGIGAVRLTLKTDLYIETAVPPGNELVHGWFVEIDLGTEGIQTLLKKCHDYEAYRRTGIEQEQGGFPLVIWSMTHADPLTAERRRRDLGKAIDRDHSLAPKLFRIVAPDQLIPLLMSGGAV